MIELLFVFFPYALIAFFGLALGAIFAPSLYCRRRRVALLLNLVGFLIYAWPAFILSIMICAPGFVVRITTGEAIMAASLTLGIFGVVEAIAFWTLCRSQHG